MVPSRHVFKVLLRLVALALGLALLAGLAYWCRPLPRPVTRRLFRGVTYTREVRASPGPVVFHTVIVEIGAPGVSFFVTPGDGARRLPIDARTTTGFLREFHVQVAMNGDFFSPWYSNNALDFYPHIGDPVEVEGYAASGGAVYSRNTSRTCRTLRFSRDHRASMTLPLEEANHAISGEALVEDGKAVPLAGSIHDPERPLPRSAVGLDREEKRLFLLVVDGRQPNYSEGVGLAELAEFALRSGAWTAINLDGGGSTSLVAESGPGEAIQLNSPAHTRIPGRERPVANHLGIRASPE